ncbi:hypothetical protein DUNSADRAFT_11737, partial [Dunaliella salina]
QVGTASHLESGQQETKPVCDQFSGSCATCTAAPGCGFCALTSKCMAANGEQGRPSLGWCPSGSWKEQTDACPDKCRYGRCMQALRVCFDSFIKVCSF